MSECKNTLPWDNGNNSCDGINRIPPKSGTESQIMTNGD